MLNINTPACIAVFLLSNSRAYSNSRTEVACLVCAKHCCVLWFILTCRKPKSSKAKPRKQSGTSRVLKQILVLLSAHLWYQVFTLHLDISRGFVLRESGSLFWIIGFYMSWIPFYSLVTLASSGPPLQRNFSQSGTNVKGHSLLNAETVYRPSRSLRSPLALMLDRTGWVPILKLKLAKKAPGPFLEGNMVEIVTWVCSHSHAVMI